MKPSLLENCLCSLQKWDSSTTVQYLSSPGCKCAGPLQHCQPKEKSDPLTFRACIGKCRSCWAQCTPERGDSSSVAVFEASKPYLFLCTSKSLMLCSAGKGRSTLKQDRSDSSSSLLLKAGYGGKAAPLGKICSPQPKHGPCVLGTCTPSLCIQRMSLGWSGSARERHRRAGAAPREL